MVFNRKTVLELAGLLLVGLALFLATGHPWLGVVLPFPEDRDRYEMVLQIV